MHKKNRVTFTRWKKIEVWNNYTSTCKLQSFPTVKNKKKKKKVRLSALNFNLAGKTLSAISPRAAYSLPLEFASLQFIYRDGGRQRSIERIRKHESDLGEHPSLRENARSTIYYFDRACFVLCRNCCQWTRTQSIYWNYFSFLLGNCLSLLICTQTDRKKKENA